jgi:hemolysin activation/secretion protein
MMQNDPLRAPKFRMLVLERCLKVAALGVLLMAPCVSAYAQNAAPKVAEVISPSFPIKGFDIEGQSPLAEGEVSRILAPFLRADATIDTLQKATAALEAALKAKGFGLHRVALPPQEVGGAIKLNIVKFVIGKVTFEGRERFTESNIRASVPELQEGASPNFKTLAVQTAIANESQGKKLQVALKESDEADKIDAHIVVKEAQPWNFSVSSSNTGSSSTGNDRLTVAGGHSNLFNLDHQLTAAYTSSVERPNAVNQMGLNYRVPLYRLGGVVGASYTQSDVLGDFGAFKSTGRGRTAGLSYSHYLPPDGGYRSYLILGVDEKQFDVALINGVPLASQAVRRSTPISLGYNGRMETDNAIWGFNLDVVANTEGGAGNDLVSYRTEDTRIRTAQWSALRGGANYTTVLKNEWMNGWLWGVRGQFQSSGNALISGEQFGLGGASSVRGTGERPLSGDSGAVMSVELTTRELMRGLRLLGFADAGWLSNNDATTSKPASDSLSSVGLGVRYVLPGFAVSFDYGYLVGGSVMPSPANSGIPKMGDSKYHLNVSAQF